MGTVIAVAGGILLAFLVIVLADRLAGRGLGAVPYRNRHRGGHRIPVTVVLGLGPKL